MGTIWLDVRYALRVLLKSPGFTLVALVALALGIGANTAIFSVVNTVLLQRLPYRDADRIAVVWEDNRNGNHPRNVTSPANFLELQSQSKSFEELAAFFDEQLNMTGAGDPVSVPSQICTVNLFRVLGAQAMIGRT